MKIVLQRVSCASVRIEGRITASINRGVCLLVGIEKGDSEKDSEYLAKKVAELRIFPDEARKMNLSLLDIQGEVLAVSQFTLAGSVSKGRRPSFDKAETPETAEPIFNDLVCKLKDQGIQVETGVFGAMMEISLTNDGPVTFMVASKKTGMKTSKE